MFVCAYLPDLVYLDFHRIDDHMASVSLRASPVWVSLQASHPHPRLGGVEAGPPVHTGELMPLWVDS